MIVRLPVSPSTNNLFQNVVGKGRIPSRQYTAWKQEAGWALKLARIKPFGTNFVCVSLKVPRKPASRDIDNFCKAVLDLLTTHQVIADDKYIERLLVERHDDADIIVDIIPFPFAARGVQTAAGGGE